MPLEDHYRKVNTPLRRLTPRERNVVIAGLTVTVVAILALILATAGDSQPPPAAGCIRTNVAGRVGGEQIHGCGRDAQKICARATTFENERAHTIVAECEKRGIKF